jgi:hypothetical protein
MLYYLSSEVAAKEDKVKSKTDETSLVGIES